MRNQLSISKGVGGHFGVAAKPKRSSRCRRSAKRFGSRVLAVLLALVMALGMLPFSALATDEITVFVSAENTTYEGGAWDNNDTYLNLTFSGEENRLGALFMDYRCVGEFVPHIIIYGHNSRHGDMFGNLRNFLDERYLNENSIITLLVNDRITEYEIFSARRTTVDDPAYFLDFSEPGS